MAWGGVLFPPLSGEIVLLLRAGLGNKKQQGRGGMLLPRLLPGVDFFMPSSPSVHPVLLSFKPVSGSVPFRQDSAPPLTLGTFARRSHARLSPCTHCLALLDSDPGPPLGLCPCSLLPEKPAGPGDQSRIWNCFWVSHAGCQGPKALGAHLVALSVHRSRNVKSNAVVAGLEPRYSEGLVCIQSRVLTPAPNTCTSWRLFK